MIIAHRGASGHRPEHTLEAYRVAIEMGADYIEPDLVATADGVLVARHENEISATTDVARRPEFAARRTTREIGGVTVTGWFTEDFTLAELKRLRVRERVPDLRPGNTLYDGGLPIPTLQEIIDLARVEGRRHGREIGIYPETKHPSYFRSIGLPLETPLVTVLRRNGLAHRHAKVYIQSFETANLRRLASLVDVPLIQLIGGKGRPYDFTATGDPRSYLDLTAPDGLAWIASYAHGIGPHKDLIVPRGAGGELRDPTTLVADAHQAGLVVHPWTFRNENQFLPSDYRIGTDPAASGDAASEYQLFFRLGVDGLFSDYPATASAARYPTTAAVGRAAWASPLR